MEKIILNETPVRTSENFNINNIKLSDLIIPNVVKDFKNIIIENSSKRIMITEDIEDFEPKYGISKELLNKNANVKNKVIVDSKSNKDVIFTFEFDNNNKELFDTNEVIVKKDSKATLVFKYISKGEESYFHNGIIKIFAEENSLLNIVFVNMINTTSNNFVALQSDVEKDAKVNYTVVDFGAKHSITNLYSNLIGASSETKINSLYLGAQEQVFDLNYIGHLRGGKANIEIEVQGALKDSAKKHFKGTIDFKKGCKKATGNENENCIFLSDHARSLALPMLLCSEEDVEGNHSCSAGKIDKKEMYYIMSRGFSKKDAMKLIVRAKFNNIINNIKNENIRELILEEIDKKLN